ncbi:MAG TPA: cyclic nucleotide-binding domain-containing protein [Anaeromyxobacteraceae bacterium]
MWGDLVATAFVESSPLFRSLDDEARQDLLQVAEQLTFLAGEEVVREGEPGDDIFMVREGQAAVSRGAEAGAQIAVLDRGAVFGEFVAMGSPVRTATVRARTALAVIRFPGAVVVALAARFPKVGRLLEHVRAARERDSP